MHKGELTCVNSNVISKNGTNTFTGEPSNYKYYHDVLSHVNAVKLKVCT
jgi:hypothetical protein